MSATHHDRPRDLPARLPYLPQLDGLRALAVCAVLLYHADVPWLPGGFLGVDLFFVLSGYLITRLLLNEWETHGTINLLGFWLRRARRLLPALLVVIAVTLAFALIWLPDEIARLRGDVVAALTYCTNWYLIFKQESYFEAMGRPSLFQHLWSLAVEEQFYLVWPPIVILLLRRFRRTGVLVGATFGVIASALAMAWLYQPDVDPSRVYYGTDTRALAPLLGAMLACVQLRTPQNATRWGKLLGDTAAFAALAGFAVACWQINEYQSQLYQGGFLIVAVVAVVAIAAVGYSNGLLSSRLLGNALLRWLGTRSYTIYLWHWPIFMISRPGLDIPLNGGWSFVLRIAATLILSELSYRLVETPIRTGLLERSWHRLRAAHGIQRWYVCAQWSVTIAAVISVALVLGVAVAEARPPAETPMLAAIDDTPAPIIAEAPSDIPTATATLPLPTLPVATALPFVVQESRDETQLEQSWAKQTAQANQARDLALSVTPEPTPTVLLATPIPETPVVVPATAQPSTEPVVEQPTPPVEQPPTEPATAQPIAEASTAEPPTAAPPVEQPPAELPTAPTVEAVATAMPITEAATAEPATAAPVSEPPTAEAATAQPTEAPPAPASSIVAIGDSVMVGAAPALRATFGDISIDAAVSRQAKAAIKILQAKRDAGQLGDVVIVHIGTNGPFSARQFDDMMAILQDVRRVVFVSVKVPRRWEGPNNTVISEGVSRYANARLADWYAASVDHPELFARDGIHPGRAGQRLFADVIKTAVDAP